MSIYTIKTRFGMPVVARDAPRRITPPPGSMEATMAAMKADAKTWKVRKAKEWAENIYTGNEALSRDRRFNWTPERTAALRNGILAILKRSPQITAVDILALSHESNRHKLSAALTELHKEGLVQRERVDKTTVWSLT